MASLPEFEYKRPKDLEEFLFLLSQYGDEAAILAGGTDFIPRLKMGLKQPKVVIDIKGISGLSYVHYEAEVIRIGALTRIYELHDNPTIRRHYPALYEAAMSTASENIRARGTIGGNILQDTRCMYYNQFKQWRTSFKPCFKSSGDRCNAVNGGNRCFAVYCGDLAPALISLGASVCLLSIDAERVVPLESIFVGDGRSPFSLRRGEVLKDVIIPAPETVGGYEKLRIRSSVDYPIVSVALSMDRTERGRLVVGAVAPQPLAYEFSSYRRLSSLTEKAYEDATPVANMPFSPLYRKRMVRVLAQKLLGRI
ncbi:MAG: FAD binding domain-containing protein [Deltaproteobacteria bacterium]|nr:FAD binding domain-containing protein [Deltaproteobacteria bacterium]